MLNIRYRLSENRPVPIKILEESAANLSEYEGIPISFEVGSRFEINVKNDANRFLLVEKPRESLHKRLRRLRTADDAAGSFRSFKLGIFCRF